MYNVKDFDQVKQNFRSFWNHEFIGIPYFQLTAPKAEKWSRRAEI